MILNKKNFKKDILLGFFTIKGVQDLFVLFNDCFGY